MSSQEQSPDHDLAETTPTTSTEPVSDAINDVGDNVAADPSSSTTTNSDSAVVSDSASVATSSSTYKHLVEQLSLDDQLAERIAQLIDTQKMTLEQLDDTTLDTLRSIQHVPAALNALAEFERLHEAPIEETDHNLPSLIELMENLQTDDAISNEEQRSGSAADSDHIAPSSSEAGSRSVSGLQAGPDETKLKDILTRTGKKHIHDIHFEK